MPLYMDIHNVELIDPDALAAAHERDLDVQAKHGVRYLKYWFSEKPGRVFCLVEAPNAQAAAAVHQEAHGMLADEIVPVREGE